MKCKVGDKVVIKSIEWYLTNADEYGNVDCGFYYFTEEMCQFCGDTMVIESINDNTKVISMVGDKHIWTKEMIERVTGESVINITQAAKICALTVKNIFPNMFQCGEELKLIEEQFINEMTNNYE